MTASYVAVPVGGGGEARGGPAVRHAEVSSRLLPAAAIPAATRFPQTSLCTSPLPGLVTTASVTMAFATTRIDRAARLRTREANSAEGHVRAVLADVVELPGPALCGRFVRED